MPSLKIHEIMSKQRTGKPYTELHEWIDHSEGDDTVNHRGEHHAYTKNEQILVETQFGGKEAVSEWLFHLVLDNLATLRLNNQYYKVATTNYYEFGFHKTRFINYSDAELTEEELKIKFKKQHK